MSSWKWLLQEGLPIAIADEEAARETWSGSFANSPESGDGTVQKYDERPEPWGKRTFTLLCSLEGDR